MNIPPYIGLAGVAGAGKDTVYERLAAMYPASFIRRSVADPLKESVGALFGIDLDTLELLKRDPDSFVKVGGADPNRPGMAIYYGGGLKRRTMREFLQRYGTESHRGVFGDDFWLVQWENWIERHRAQSAMLRVGPYSYVNTSVRFENEAQRILDLGGEVWHIDGPQDEGAGTHESEARLPDHLISRVIDNSWREPMNDFLTDDAKFAYLDQQIAELIA